MVTSTLELKKRLEMRGYQETIVIDILNNFGINKPYVLGSCPSSGKTEMAIEAMIRLIESEQVNRVLILAHSTNVLKENFYQRLGEYFNESDIEIMSGQKGYNYDARIQVMIPQNIKHVIGNFDLIITDEAHHNVLAEDGNYSRIVTQVEPKFQLLLTGTPSKFVRKNNEAEDQNDLPYHINTVGMDMVGFEFFHDVRFDLIRSAYGFTNADYNQNQDVSSDTKFSLGDTERTINNVIIGAVRNIALRNGITLSKTADCVLEGRKLIQEGKFGKTLIMCRSIEQANQVKEIISSLFKINVKVSESQNDIGSNNITKFKEGKFEFLCVVNRAREGYDDKKIINLIDITMTHNIDLIYQMFCRVVRKDVNNPNPKLYLKVTSNAEGMSEYTMNIMTAALMLGATENLTNFNGSNFRGITMPRVERIEGDEDDVIVGGAVGEVDTEGNIIRRRNISDLMALDLVRIFTDDHENLISGNDRYAMTTLGESLQLLGVDFYSDKEGYFNLIRIENITSGGKWGDKYKELSERDGVKYHSQPWRFFNQTVKEFFDECYPNNILYTDKEGYIDLIRIEDISNGDKWGEKYKELSERDGVKYYSAPWVNFKQSVKEFFDECYPERQEFYSDKQGYFDLIRIEDISSGGKWREKYKGLSERDILKYHSHPHRLFNQIEKEFFDECYPEREEFYSNKEGYFDLIRVEDISSNNKWVDKYKELSERDGVKYHSTPWVNFKQSVKEFFDECYPERQEFYSDKQGYFDLIRIEDISSSDKWMDKYKELSERDGVKYHSQPWNLFKQSVKEFFDECYPNNILYRDKQGYFNLFRVENITGGGKWREKYKGLSERDILKYHSKPWRFFNQTVKEFFEECYPEREEFYSDKQGYFDLFRVENIIGNKWGDKYKELSERDGVKYYSTPWRFFNQTVKEFFEECYPERQEFYSDKQGYFDLFRVENISGNKKWGDKYKELSERDGVKYYSTPWSLFKQSVKEFFDECSLEKEEFYSDKQGYFDLIRLEDISSGGKWFEKYKELSERDILKYHSQPWVIFNQSIKEFFNEYRQWLKDNSISKKEYKPAYLGEFSEMNKTWNTSNSNTNHKRLKGDPTEWFKYHSLYSKARAKWSEIPYIEISKKIKGRPEWIVGDFGCGENLLCKELKNKVHSFDHVAIDGSVTSCDLTDIPLHNEVLDVVVFSLALMHTNYLEYLKEAYRVLKLFGSVFIAEPRQRWSDDDGNLDDERIKDLLTKAGFKLTGEVKVTERFIYIDAIKY